MEKALYLTSAFGAGVINYFFGGWDIMLSVLITFMVLDIGSGLIKSLYLKSEKTTSGGLDSRIMAKGIARKVLLLAIVAVGVAADRILLPDGTAIRTLVIGFYIAEEGLSILENVAQCGLKLPAKLTNVLEEMQKQNNQK